MRCISFLPPPSLIAGPSSLVRPDTGNRSLRHLTGLRQVERMPQDSGRAPAQRCAAIDQSSVMPPDAWPSSSRMGSLRSQAPAQDGRAAAPVVRSERAMPLLKRQWRCQATGVEWEIPGQKAQHPFTARLVARTAQRRIHGSARDRIPLTVCRAVECRRGFGNSQRQR